MRHLDDMQLVDAADGACEAAAAAHLADCESCRTRVAEIGGMLRTVADVEVPEPSPLFWEHFPSRVARALDAPHPRRGWLASPRLAWGAAAAAVLVVLSLAWLPDRAAEPDGTSVMTAADPARTTTGETPADREPMSDDIEVDAAWALVRSVAEEVEYDDVRAVGVAPPPGSIETAAMELSAGERAELARIIARELKRSGA